MLSTSYFQHFIHFGGLALDCASIATSNTPPGSNLSVGVIKSLQIWFVNREVPTCTFSCLIWRDAICHDRYRNLCTHKPNFKSDLITGEPKGISGFEPIVGYHTLQYPKTYFTIQNGVVGSVENKKSIALTVRKL